ncbi:hypothetical protein C8J55DRAFT_425636 [Lentinula edodes]|uniref:Uncharacterized protein n=1 Tax=Lentinula lateritia TaxID=40482 RepID=A0A9W9DT62_9AGAR|nr:hypothetical protein C8J55DRAFT_425636 [Lentinula edodes]
MLIIAPIHEHIINVPFGVTYEKIGTIQRRLAWPLHKDDTLSRSGRSTDLNIYFAFCRENPVLLSLCRGHANASMHGSTGKENAMHRRAVAFNRMFLKFLKIWQLQQPQL